MNERIVMASSALVAAMILLFAGSMVAHLPHLAYETSLVLFWGYVLMACSFSATAGGNRLVAAQAGIGFGVLYCGFSTAVYFIQLTTVLRGTGAPEVLKMLTYQELGSVMFNLELLGYGLMAISTFFLGLAVSASNTPTRWLKILLLAHGAFAPVCVAMPMLDLFGSMPRAAGATIGVDMSFAWCAYFLLIAILVFFYFQKSDNQKDNSCPLVVR